MRLDLITDPAQEPVISGDQAKIETLEVDAEDCLKLGNALYNEGRYEEAIAAYDKAIDLNRNIS